MKVNLSNHIPLDKLSHKNGFGYAMEHIEKSLIATGHEIGEENADVQLWWDQPHWIKWAPDQYRIAYFPWESTKLLEGWFEIIDTADEIWTPSPLIAGWIRDLGVTPPVFVYEHGVEPVWAPRVKVPGDTLKFLNMGFESARKYGSHTLQAFRKAFPHRDDVQLTLKMWMPSMQIEYGGKITVVNEKYEFDQLHRLFDDHDAFAFVSAGEGFGLPPLQAMAMGMPTITNGVWAPYEQFIDPKLNVRSDFQVSPWNDLHPGMIYRPDFDDLVDKFRYVADNYMEAHTFALDQAPSVCARYDWNTLTKNMFDQLEIRLKDVSEKS